jgi:hypothetical protein
VVIVQPLNSCAAPFAAAHNRFAASSPSFVSPNASLGKVLTQVLTRGHFRPILPPSWQQKTRRLQRVSVKRMKGLEPSTFCMASRRSSQLSYIRGRGGL